MNKRQIQKLYKEYFQMAGLGLKDFKDFLKDVWEASIQGSVSFALSNFPNKYKWEVLLRDGKVNNFIKKALECHEVKKFENYFLHKLNKE